MANSNFPKLKLTLFFFISSFAIITKAQLTYIHQYCYNGSYSFSSDYHDNIEKAISALASKASTSYYNTHTVGLGEDKVNALYYCRYDVSLRVCQSCVSSAANNISRCLGDVGSLIAYEECTVHYANRTIFPGMDDSIWIYGYINRTADNLVRFDQFLGDLIDNLTTDAASISSSSRYFSTRVSRYSSDETIYALAQCNPDITSFECKTCLQNGFQDYTTNFTSRIYGQIFLPSCRLSYLLTSEVLSPPWQFARSFDSNGRRPTPIPRYTYPTSGTRRASSTFGVMVAILFYAAHFFKLLL